MAVAMHPAVAAFCAQVEDEFVLAQVLIRRLPQGWELRHASDCAAAAGSLTLLRLEDLRALAQFTARGAFRPLKSAPHLKAGWRVHASNPIELGRALNILYPGAVADWFAAHQSPPPTTDYVAFTQRQTGMYRATQTLSPSQVARLTQACCHPDFCLKRRLWRAGPLGPDDGSEKSAIPCLEPCAILLEFARCVAGWEAEKPGEGTPALAEAGAAERSPDAREADFGAMNNPRRLRWGSALIDS